MFFDDSSVVVLDKSGGFAQRRWPRGFIQPSLGVHFRFSHSSSAVSTSFTSTVSRTGISLDVFPSATVDRSWTRFSW
jgi:hypothetical protein